MFSGSSCFNGDANEMAKNCPEFYTVLYVYMYMYIYTFTDLFLSSKYLKADLDLGTIENFGNVNNHSKTLWNFAQQVEKLTVT